MADESDWMTVFKPWLVIEVQQNIDNLTDHFFIYCFCLKPIPLFYLLIYAAIIYFSNDEITFYLRWTVRRVHNS